MQSLRQWLQDAWTASWPEEQLLHPVQEIALWRDAIEQDEAGRALLSPLAAAREARRAEQLLLRHRLQPERAALPSEDVRAFLRWRRTVRTRMAREGWLCAGDLPGAVAQKVAEGRIPAPAALTLAGFLEEPVPAEAAVLAALAHRGTQITRRALPANGGGAVQGFAVADAEAQFRAVALSIRERLRPFADHRQPPPRIVLALPDPEARRDFIETLFRPILAPWLSLPAEGQRAAPWRFDAGRALTEQPLVATALDIAALRLIDNMPATVSRLLLSSALWSDEQRAAAAAADLRLRDEGWPRIRWLRLLQALPPALRGPFERLGACLREAPARALPSDWAEHYRRRLAALGWPGSTPLDSIGYQLQREWQRLLARLGTMDGQLGRVSAAEALQWLRELAAGTRFEPRVEHLQPVVILPLEDAVGLPCEALYLADLAPERFPGGVAASPYLPPEQQAACGIAGASAALALQRAQRLAAHLCGLAPAVELYAPAVDERGAETQPSPLFTALAPWQSHTPPRSACGLERETLGGARLSMPAADPVPPVDAGERAGLHADAGLFRAFFESAFFAFCLYRLGIGALPRPARGLDPRRQGVAAHGALQAIWQTLHDSAALAALDDGALDAQVRSAVAARLTQDMPEADYGRVQVALEQARLCDLLSQWLRHERRRCRPFSAERIEALLEVSIAGLAMRLRVDRVDRVDLPQGERWLVIDYKTGRHADPRGWDPEVLSEPQLPLYASHAAAAILGVPQIDGICFGHVKDGHPALVAQTNWCKRLIDPEEADLRESWDANLAAWRLRLAAAATAFLDGEAGLDPAVAPRPGYADLLWLAGRDGDGDD